MPEFTAYHNVDAATHQNNVDELSRAGFRPVALNVSGDPSDARFAAVWVRRPGSLWYAVHGLNAKEYQSRFDELTNLGFAPTIVSATGPLGGEVFAGVFERGVTVPWFARHGLREGPDTDPDTLAYENNRAAEQGFLPRCLAEYGTPGDRRYAGIWMGNSAAVQWSWWSIEGLAYQRFFDALVSGGMRPAVLNVAPDETVLTVFRGDRVGDWRARHSIDATEYQREFDANVQEGRRPIVVASNSQKYAAVFAVDDTPAERDWRVTGGGFNGAEDLDEAVRAYMVRHGIRAGAVAIGRGGGVIGARGYTWAERTYPATRPETVFRIASLSKIFAAAETSRLVAAGRLAWDTKAFQAAGITSALPAGTTPTPGMDAITVEQLVLRMSRLPRDFDQPQRDIAAALGIGTAPISRHALLRYLYGRPLIDPPPPAGSYSNTAFYLLTAVIEAASGLPFSAAVRRDVLEPLGITDVAVATTAATGNRPDEVPTYDDADVGLSLLDYSAGALAPNAYGGAFVLETCEGSGGLLASAGSIVRVIARHPVWNADRAHLTGREVATRYGTWDGVSSGATCRRDGLDFAFLFNRRVSEAGQDEIRDAINAVLTAHADEL